MKVIKALRSAKGLTLKDISNLTGINADTLSLLENGKRDDLNEEQKERLHRIFPMVDRKSLFAELDIVIKSNPDFRLTRQGQTVKEISQNIKTEALRKRALESANKKFNKET